MVQINVEVRVLNATSPLLFAWWNKDGESVDMCLVTCPCQGHQLLDSKRDAPPEDQESHTGRLTRAFESSQVISVLGGVLVPDLSSLKNPKKKQRERLKEKTNKKKLSRGKGEDTKQDGEFVDGFTLGDNKSGPEHISDSSRIQGDYVHGHDGALADSLTDDRIGKHLECDAAQEHTKEVNLASKIEQCDVKRVSGSLDATRGSQHSTFCEPSGTLTSYSLQPSNTPQSPGSNGGNQLPVHPDALVSPVTSSTISVDQNNEGTPATSIDNTVIQPESLAGELSTAGEGILSTLHGIIGGMPGAEEYDEMGDGGGSRKGDLNLGSSMSKALDYSSVIVTEEEQPCLDASLTKSLESPPVTELLTDPAGPRDENPEQKPKKKKKKKRKDRVILCEICGKSLTNRSIKKHVKIFHRKGGRVRAFKCDRCPSSFYSQQNLGRHTRVHDGVRYQCRFCDNTYRQNRTRKVHENVHFPPDQPIFVYKKKGTPREQTRYTYQSVDVTCTICGKSVKKTYLKGHMELHAGKTYTCDICGAEVKYGSRYHHMKLHTQEKNHCCPLCQKAFRFKAGLQMHQRTHTKERPYKCHFCELTFSRYGTRINHERLHTGVRPYRCDPCEKSWRDRPTYMQHMSKHHPGTPLMYITRSRSRPTAVSGPPGGQTANVSAVTATGIGHSGIATAIKSICQEITEVEHDSIM